MPFVNVKLTGGDGAPTQEQKEEIIAGITDVLVRVLQKNPATTFVVIDEISTDNWGVSGKSITELQKKA